MTEPRTCRGRKPRIWFCLLSTAPGSPFFGSTTSARCSTSTATTSTRSSGVSAAIWPGETLGLVGESGSGKTTLARTLLGIVAPTTGAADARRRALAPRYPKRTKNDLRALQIVFQNPDSALNRRHSVRRILLRSLKKLAGWRGSARPTKRLRQSSSGRVRLSERTLTQKPVQLSGGLKQRVAIARAFAGDPKLVVCDEPTSALDVSVQAAILNLLVELQAEHGVSYLFISHDLGVVRYISDRIAVLYLGRLMELGPADVVFDGPHHPYTEALLSAVPTIDGGGRERIKLEGEIPSAADPAERLRLPHPVPAQGRRDLRGRGAAARRGRAEATLMRCHIPLEELRGCSRSAVQAGREDPRRRARGDGRPFAVQELDLADPGPGEVLVRLGASWRLPFGFQRDRRHGRDALPGRARPRGRRRRRGDRARRHARRRRRSRRALVGAVVRRVRRVPARPAAALLDGVAGDGHGRAAGRHDAALARRRARLPLLVPLHVRRGVRAPGALVRADSARRAVRRRRPRRLRRYDGCRRRLAHRRRAPRRSRRRDRLRRRRALGGDGSGRGRRRDDHRRRRQRAEARRRGGLRRDRRRALGRLARGDRGCGARGVRRRRRLRDRGDRPPRGDARRVPLDARTAARRC